MTEAVALVGGEPDLVGPRRTRKARDAALLLPEGDGRTGSRRPGGRGRRRRAGRGGPRRARRGRARPRAPRPATRRGGRPRTSARCSRPAARPRGRPTGQRHERPRRRRASPRWTAAGARVNPSVRSSASSRRRSRTDTTRRWARAASATTASSRRWPRGPPRTRSRSCTLVGTNSSRTPTNRAQIDGRRRERWRPEVASITDGSPSTSMAANVYRRPSRLTSGGRSSGAKNDTPSGTSALHQRTHAEARSCAKEPWPMRGNTPSTGDLHRRAPRRPRRSTPRRPPIRSSVVHHGAAQHDLVGGVGRLAFLEGHGHLAGHAGEADGRAPCCPSTSTSP